MKSLSSKTYQCGVTIEGLTTLAGITYLTGITNTTSWDHVIVGTTAQGQIYTRTYAQFMTDVATGIGLSGYVPTSRTLSINGVTYDLTANRSWTITTPYVSKLQHSVKAGVAINKGQAVYVTGADGTNMVVGLASNASEATSSKTMGLLDATVSTNGFANVVTEGLLAGLDTSTAGFEGDPVWLGTGGNLIYGLINKPYAPAHLVFIGIVTRKNNSNGEIFVKVQNGFELNEIHDVDLKTNLPVNGELLGFNGTLWVNKTIAGWLGYTPANASGTTNYLSKFTGSTTLGNSLVYDNGTNVGIGTTSPSAKLSVAGSLDVVTPGNASGITMVGNSNHDSIFKLQNTDSTSNTFGLRFETYSDGGSNRIVDLVPFNSTGTNFQGVWNFNSRTVFSAGIQNNYWNNFDIVHINSNPGQAIRFFSVSSPSGSGTPIVSFVNTGNVLIGTTTDSGYKLDVNGTARINSSLYVSDPAYTGAGRFYQAANATTIISGGPAGENITFGPSNRIFLNAGQTRFPSGSVQMVGTLTLGSLNATGTNMLLMQGSVTAGSALGRGIGMDTTLVAAANNDVLVGLDVNPTFTNGAFTGVSNVALRVASITSLIRIESSSTSSFHGIEFRNSTNLDAEIKQLPSSGEFRISNGRSVGWGGFTTFYTDTVERMRIRNNGNIIIGATADAGYKLDVNGTTRFLASTETISRFDHTNGNYASLVVGNGSALAAGQFGMYFNGGPMWSWSGAAFRLHGNVLSTANNPSTLILQGGYGGSTVGTSIKLSSNTPNQGQWTVTSGSQVTVEIGSHSNETWAPSSGNASYTLLSVAPRIDTTGTYAGIVRGFYYNPTLTSITGVTHRGAEIASGDFVWGNGYSSFYGNNVEGFVQFQSSGNSTKIWIRPSSNQGAFNGNYWGYLENSGYTTTLKSGDYHDLSLSGESIRFKNQYLSELARFVGGSGNLLIGTTTDAGYKLDVNGTARFSGNTYLAGDILVSNGSGTRYIQSPNGGIGFLSSNSSGYNLWTANTGVGIKSELYINSDLNYNTGIRLRIGSTQTSPSGYSYELSFQSQVNHVPTYTAIRTLDSSYGGNLATPSPIYIFGGQNTTTGVYAHVILQSDFTTARGYVGVGTTSPTQLLHVAGNLRLTGAFYDSNNSAGTAGQILKSTATGTDWVSLSEITGVDGTGTANYLAKWSDADTITTSLIYDNGTNITVGTSTGTVYLNSNIGSGAAVDINGQYKFYYAQLQGNGSAYFTTYVTVGATGNLGATLNVKGTGATSSTKSLYIANSDTTRTLSYTDDGKLTLSNGTYTTKWYTGSGYSPTLEFSAQGNITWGNGAIFKFYGTGDTTEYRLENGTFHTTNSQARFYAGGSGYLGFETIGATTAYDAIGAVFTDNNTVSLRFFYKNTASDIEGMRLTSNGNFLVGTTTDSGYKLDVNGTARIQGNLTVSSGNQLRLNDSTNANTATISYSSTGQQGPGVVSAWGGNGVFGWNNSVFNLLHAGTGNDVILLNRSVLSAGTTSGNALWLTGYGSFAPTTGTNSFNAVNIGTTYNATGGTSTIRGIYYNPVLTSMTGVTHRAIETVTGDVLFATTSGSVGIGTTSPSYKLDVNGTIRTQTGYILGANTQADIILDGSTGSQLRYGTQKVTLNSSNVSIFTADVNRLFIANAGNVGIGTTSPSYKLQVTGGDIAIDYNRYLRGGSGGDWNLVNLYNGGTGDMEITMLNTNWYLRHNANATFAGKVGIGTTNPTAKLTIGGTLASGFGLELNEGTYRGSFTATNGGTYVQGYSNGLHLGSNGNNTVKLTWDDKVGIGTLSPSAKTHIVGLGSSSSTTSLLIQNSSGASMLQVRDDNFTVIGPNGLAIDNFNCVLYRTSFNSQSISFHGSRLSFADATGFVFSNDYISTPAASAIFDIQSTTKGFLQPRLTTTQKNAISTPATGLQVYDSTLNKNALYNGSVWQSIATETWVTSQAYVPQATTITINGTTYDLSANRSWTIATTTPGGSNTQFQYNSSGTLAGASALTYNSATNRVGINQASPGYDLDVNGQVRVQDKLRVGNVNSGNGVVHMSSSATINPSATTIVWSQNVSVGMCAFIEYYILNNNTTTDQRAGTIMVTWNQSGTPTIAHTETTTPDIGSTTPVIFTSSLVGSDARINAVNASSAPYTIVMNYRYF